MRYPYAPADTAHDDHLEHRLEPLGNGLRREHLLLQALNRVEFAQIWLHRLEGDHQTHLRHIYFEEITHLFNIQRLKRAQGLPTSTELPRVGYWALDGWDVSEA